jgi:hypothetical protein
MMHYSRTAVCTVASARPNLLTSPASIAYYNLFLGYKKAQFRARTRFPCYWLPRPRLRGLVLVSAEERACTEFPISNTSHV